ncbi:hypothetical protein SAY86_022330 [Trapa natans]|uniref:Pentatricopeptide repeat-containing protein n=1 Tax=Trapa natans TaxID=22666 RepID=A0AAN7LTC6_TRANT|nr:hypothetical protein SAY86_022330 [Trapa natans]
MNLLRSNLTRGNAVSEIFRGVFYTTQAPAAAVTSPPKDTLRRRILRAGDPRISMADVANKWIEEGRPVNLSEIQRSVRILRKYRRCQHALQLMEWMTEHLDFKLKSSDIAIELDLIGKVRGLEEVEKYFEKIPEKSRDYKIYGSLLSCYAHDKSMEQAEAIMQKMRQLGFAKLLSYNVMLSLYSKTKQFDKMDELMQEMKERGMSWDIYTYNIRLNAYALAFDVEGMEKLLSEMGSDPSMKIDWNTFVVIANGYLICGLPEKALAMMKKAEQVTSLNNWKGNFEILLTLYSQMGNKVALYRLWDEYKKKGTFDNTTYLAMVTSLVKVDDISGAERIVEEWEYGKNFYDIRIPRFLISTYCKKGLLEKAEAYMSRLVEIGAEPEASLWGTLASGYEYKKEMQKALEVFKKAISFSKPGWRPNKFTIASCLDYLKEKGEIEAAQELLQSLQEYLPQIIYDTLLNYVNNDNNGTVKAINHLESAWRQPVGLSSLRSDPKDDQCI